MKPYETEGRAWAHEKATAIVDAQLGWSEDRIQLLRTITNALNETFDTAYLKGESQGYTNAMFSVFQNIHKASTNYPPLARQLLDWCRDVVVTTENKVIFTEDTLRRHR